MPSLLPPNSTDLERALARAARVDTLPAPLRGPWDADSCPDGLLPWLAWTLHVDYQWALAESGDARREVIRKSFETHRMKGTPWAIREVFRALGFGEIDLIEGLGGIAYDGAFAHDGVKHYGGGPTDWAVYRVVLLDRAVTNDQARALREVLAEFAPARCHLDRLIYQSVPIRYNARANHDGQYNFGSAG